MIQRFLLIFAIAIGLPAVAAAEEEKDLFVAAEGHWSLLSDTANRSMLTGTYGYGLRGGYRFKKTAVFLHAEHNLWVATEYKIKPVYGAFNIGPGIEYCFGGGLVRSSFTMGLSILAQDTLLDDAGSTGFFIDMRPAGFRWKFNKSLIIGLDPLTLSIVAPVLDTIPLIQVEYRTQLYLEMPF